MHYHKFPNCRNTAHVLNLSSYTAALLVFLLCALLFLQTARPLCAQSLSDQLSDKALSSSPNSYPALQLYDSSGTFRWQLPVTLWVAPSEELGGWPFPAGFSPTKPISLQGPLVFVGYGLTREGWDDYAGQRIDGAVAVVFTGAPPSLESDVETNPTDIDNWPQLIEEKVENAKSHGAVAVLLERNPLLSCPSAVFPTNFPGQLSDWPASAPTIWTPRISRASLPIFSIGTRTLEVIVSLSSDLFAPGITTGDSAFYRLMQDIQNHRQPIPPLPLLLEARLSWNGGRLTKAEGRRSDIWYEADNPVFKDISFMVAACDATIESIENLLAVNMPNRTSILLFSDWRSKFFCTSHLGMGAAAGNKMTMVYSHSESDPAILAHEICHLAAAQIGHPPECFNEGLGQLVGDTLGDLNLITTSTLDADRLTAANLKNGALWSLPELLALPDIGGPGTRPVIAYPQAASFCAYIIRQIGFDGFRQLYAALEKGQNQQNIALIEKTLGKNLQTIETAWHNSLPPPPE